jgi:hypothetical protein
VPRDCAFNFILGIELFETMGSSTSRFPWGLLLFFIPFRVQYPAASGGRRGSGLAPRLIPFIRKVPYIRLQTESAQNLDPVATIRLNQDLILGPPEVR